MMKTKTRRCMSRSEAECERIAKKYSIRALEF